MKPDRTAGKTAAVNPLVRRYNREITAAQYVRSLDERSSQLRKDTESHRRKK